MQLNARIGAFLIISSRMDLAAKRRSKTASALPHLPRHQDGHRGPAAPEKADRVFKAKHGLKQRKGPPMPGSKASGWKRKMDGTLVRR